MIYKLSGQYSSQIRVLGPPKETRKHNKVGDWIGFWDKIKILMEKLVESYKVYNWVKHTEQMLFSFANSPVIV